MIERGINDKSGQSPMLKNPSSLSFMDRLRKAGDFQDNSQLVTVLLFLPPALTLFTLFVIIPMMDAGYYSFFKWSGYGEPSNFIGFRNYEKVFNHHVFGVSLWNSTQIILVSLIIQFPLALAMALLISANTRINQFFRLIFFLPFILAEVVAGLIWRFVYDGNYGIPASVAKMTDTEPFFILASADWAFYAVLLVIVWKYFGIHMMILIAGLQNISKDLIEAASLDGANPFQIARRIQIPLLVPAIKVALFLSIIGSLQAFDLIVPLTNGGPNNQSHTIVSFLYTFGITRMKVGFGSAIGIVLFIICITIAFIYQRKVMKND